MAIDTPTHRLAPEPERPYWQNEGGERLTFQQALARGDAQVTAEQHAEAICAIAHAAARARLRGEEREARRLAHAAAQLCGEIVGLWPHDSWKPIR